MAQEVNKKQTLGRFDIVCNIAVDSKTFAMGTKGKNNAKWISNVFNPKIEGANGASMFLRIQDGYNEVEGKTLYLMSVNDESMEVKFADRLNPAIVSLVNDKSFIKVFVNRVEKVNEETGNKFMTWEEPKKFLTAFDAITYLQSILPLASKNKVRITGDVKYSKFNDKIQKNFELKSFYILTNNEEEGKERPLGFNFTQNIILLKDCVDMSKFEEEGVATVKAKLYVKKPKVKDAYELLTLPLTIRATEENKNTYRNVLNKYMIIEDENKVRRINIEGFFQVGYVSGNVDEKDLPQTALELIEDGFYSKEEVLKMFLKRDRVDETIIRRPIVRLVDGTPKVDMSEEDYTIEDIKAAMVDSPSQSETINIDVEDDVISSESLLDELNGL